jgi:hypothetical protein
MASGRAGQGRPLEIGGHGGFERVGLNWWEGRDRPGNRAWPTALPRLKETAPPVEGYPRRAPGAGARQPGWEEAITLLTLSMLGFVMNFEAVGRESEAHPAFSIIPSLGLRDNLLPWPPPLPRVRETAWRING